MTSKDPVVGDAMLPTSKKRSWNCVICSKPVFSTYSKYCRSCSQFVIRMGKQLTPKAIKGLVKYIRKNGFRCYYTGMLLEMKNFKDPWYCVFNRLRPGDSSRMVITSTLLTEMKEDKTEGELWYFVLELDDHKRKHTKFRKRNPVHWRRLAPPGVRACPKCGQAILSKGKRYCPDCVKTARRINARRFSREGANSVWDYIRKYGYVCYYTGRPLEMRDYKSPWYCSFDHLIPRDDRKIVLTSRLINEMKQDMLADEFWRVIHMLAEHRRRGTPVRKIKLRYWLRPYHN